MTFNEAKKWADSRTQNAELYFVVLKFNNKYIVYDSNHIKRNPSLKSKILYNSKTGV